MAKRTYLQKANLIIDRVRKDRNDTTFKNFVLDCLKLTLQEIVAAVPYARWLMDEVSLTTAAGTQYVDITSSGIDIDNIVDVRDETNNFKSRRISPEEASDIDPGRDLSGQEFLWWIQTVWAGGTPAETTRIYFLNKPDSVDTLKVICGKPVTDPAEGETSVLPAKYESIEIDGALPKVWERIDPDRNTSEIRSRFIGGYNAAGEPTGLCRIIHDARISRGQIDVLHSHRPLRGSGISGPSWPSDFNTLP